MESPERDFGLVGGAGPPRLGIALPRIALAVFLVCLLAAQVFLITPPPEQIRVGEAFPLSLAQGGKSVERLPADCSMGFVVSTSCPHCARLAEAYLSPTGGTAEQATEDPIWIVLEGSDAARDFAQEHGIPRRLVYGVLPSRGWLFRPREAYVPFTPMGIILDKVLTVRDLSQNTSAPGMAALEALCVSRAR
jgi:hypothetical protein